MFRVSHLIAALALAIIPLKAQAQPSHIDVVREAIPIPVTRVLDANIQREGDVWTGVVRVNEPGNRFTYNGTLVAGEATWSPELPISDAPGATNFITMLENDGFIGLAGFADPDDIAMSDFHTRLTHTPNPSGDEFETWTQRVSNVTFTVETRSVYTPSQFLNLLIANGMDSVRANIYVNAFLLLDFNQVTDADQQAAEGAAGGPVKVKFHIKNEITVGWGPLSWKNETEFSMEGDSASIRRETQEWLNMFTRWLKDFVGMIRGWTQ